MQLKCKTKGNIDPKGKPKVYFCCHFNDFDKYFKEITDEILAKQDCAIWYSDSTLSYDEEVLFELKQMQLFVVPVTSNLLFTDNSALDVEFSFAVENHIPVLPLMQESGLEVFFNKKCGDLQFLDKFNIDDTAISYDEKLKKYLESVLIGDELAEKIRGAFDAYVFLSYRKKDRKFAQELMQLIHKNEFCRDIAIWYDEFLTPGENFNDSIKAALEKSELFVLTVTPNLVEEDNYIMTQEYPMAKKSGKLILPAELVPTDREQLFQKYKDIPIPTNAYNDKELSKSLLDSIKHIAIKETDSSPEHTYFIGLAYLGGVDVEVDYERARKLIREAADRGLIAAYETLVNMYKEGRGVERDFSEAIIWQIKLAELCYEQYNANPTIDTITAVCNANMLLGDMCKEFNLIDEAEDAYSTMLSAAKSLDEQIDSTSSKEMLISAFNRLSLIKKEKGLFKDFNDLAERIIKMSKSLYDEKAWLAVAYTSNLGLSYYFLQDYTKAKECFEKALNSFGELSLSEDLLVLKARIHNNLGLALTEISEPENAIQQCIEAYKIIEEINESTDYKYIEDYGLFVSSLVSAYIVSKNYDDAEKILKIGYKTVKRFFREQKQPRLISAIASMQNLLGRLYYERGNSELAEKYYKDALNTYSCYDDGTAEVVYRSEKALVYNNIGSLYVSQKEYGKAIEILVKAHNNFTELAQNEKTYRIMKALSGFNLAVSLFAQRNYKDAVKYCLITFDIYKKFLDEGLSQYSEKYKSTVKLAAATYFMSGHPIKAIKFLSKATETQGKIW